MYQDLDVFYTTLLTYLSRHFSDFSIHCITPWKCLRPAEKKALITAFSSALAFFHGLGFTQTHSLDKFIAQIVCFSFAKKHAISVKGILACLQNLEAEFDEAFPGYAKSTISLSVLRERLNG